MEVKPVDHLIAVDDDPSILELLGMILEGEGYRVQTFGSGEEAYQACLSQQPTAAIVDLNMPDMNGLELLRALRHDPRTGEIPVLICSAYYGDLRRTIYLLEQDGQQNVYFLRKPFRIQDLLEMVQVMVSGSATTSLPDDPLAGAEGAAAARGRKS